MIVEVLGPTYRGREMNWLRIHAPYWEGSSYCTIIPKACKKPLGKKTGADPIFPGAFPKKRTRSAHTRKRRWKNRTTMTKVRKNKEQATGNHCQIMWNNKTLTMPLLFKQLGAEKQTVVNVTTATFLWYVYSVDHHVMQCNMFMTVQTHMKSLVPFLQNNITIYLRRKKRKGMHTRTSSIEKTARYVCVMGGMLHRTI